MQHIKELMKAGDVKVAADELKKRLAANPDNAMAKMLYGTCCHLLGDDKTFMKIHDELAPKMEGETDEKKVSLWRKYHAIWLTLIGVGLILVAGVYYIGHDLVNMFCTASPAAALYAGPGYYETNDSMREPDAVHQWIVKDNFERKVADETDRVESSDLTSALWQSVESNDVANLKRLLAAGANPNAKGERNVSLLGRAVTLYACKKGRVEVIHTLLEHGADPNQRWGTGNSVTPFWSFVQGAHLHGESDEYKAGCIAIVRMMLRKGADPNAKYGIRQVGALGVALIWNNHLELVKALVEGGAEITDKMIEDAKGEVKRYLTDVRNGTIKVIPITRDEAGSSAKPKLSISAREQRAKAWNARKKAIRMEKNPVKRKQMIDEDLQKFRERMNSRRRIDNNTEL